MNSIFLCSLLSIVYGGMIIDIDVRTPKPLVEVRGETFIHDIADQERIAFGIEDEQLKTVIAAYTNDTEPYKVSVKIIRDKCGGPEEYKDWMNVKTTVKVRLVNITKNCIQSGADDYIPDRITVKTEWKIMGKLAIDENTYQIYSKENITFKSLWEENTLRNEDFGLILPSNEEAKRGDVHFVQAIKCDLVASLQYEASLSGLVIADYSSKEMKKYHVQAHDLAVLQTAADLPRNVINTETISVSYYYKKTERDGVDDYDYSSYDYSNYMYEDNVEVNNI